MDVNHCVTEGSERSEEHGRENIYCFRENLSPHEQTLQKYDMKGSASGDSDENEMSMLLEIGRKWQKVS